MRCAWSSFSICNQPGDADKHGACAGADIAIERGYDYYFWGHSDVAVMGKNSSASFGADVVACTESLMTTNPDWGILYFAYDWFSAIRTDLVRQVSFSGAAGVMVNQPCSALIIFVMATH